MEKFESLALETWYEASKEGVLVVDTAGAVRLMNARLRTLFDLSANPSTVQQLVESTAQMVPGLQAVLTSEVVIAQAQWGNILIQKPPSRRLNWRQVPLMEGEQVVGYVTIFEDTTNQGQLEVAKQSFLSMISHDLRTPLSTILGFAELLYHNRSNLSEAEQREFLEHIIKNANQLSRYTEIALDIMFLEANMQHFELEPVVLHRFVRHWMTDALHRFSATQLVLQNGANEGPMTNIAPSALHKILHILVEFALAESPPEAEVKIGLRYEGDKAHVLVSHHAPNLSAADAAALFQLMHPRDLSEIGRPPLHRMQMYVASLLAERQQGHLTLRAQDQHSFQIDLALPVVA